MTAPALAPRPAAWLGRGAWTVLDQGLFAGANFAVNVLLARWLPPEAYGAFTVAFIVFLLLGAIHGGLLVEPMLVFGAGRYEGRTPAYLRTLLAAHARFSVAAALAMAAAAAGSAALGQGDLAAVFAVLAGVQALVLFLWLMRRACYVVFRPEWAAAAGAVYLVLVVTGAFALERADALSGPAALGVMSAGALVSGAWLAWRLGVRYAAAPDAALAADARGQHLRYGRWAAATGVVEWTHNALPFLVLPLFAGLAGSGTLRALYNLAMPALQAFSALTILAVPAFVQARRAARLRATFLRTASLLIGLGLANALVIGLFGPALIDLLYRGQYEATPAMLWLLALLPLASVSSGLLMAVLRSSERPRAVFRARAAAAGTTATLGTALTALFGVAGALAADLAGLVVEGLLMLRAIVRGEKKIGAAADEAAHEEPAGRAGERRLRVLVNAFACKPGEGSEEGVGWGVTRALAEEADVWVLVHQACAEALEQELAARPVPGLHVLPYALPWESAAYRTGQKVRGGLLEQVHYYLWQFGAARLARRTHRRVGFDVAQHVTYVKYWAPSALAFVPVPYVWGTVGGGESAPRQFYAAFSREGRRYERLRDAAQRLAHLDPFVRLTARRAARGYATSEETAARMRCLGAADVRVLSSVALPDAEVEHLASFPPPPEGPLRFLCIGRLLHLKGFDYAIRGFAAALAAARAAGSPALDGATLDILGEGPERAR
ncbi:MAG: hypothetical protein ACK41D_11535, partial [Rubricoccaceae bacterium]